MDDLEAAEKLRELLDDPNARTRYGAFRALWAMNPANPVVRGEQMAADFSYHVQPNRAVRRFRPEPPA
jgi:hypothetical protein